ncbi:MAG: hypothetical protein EXS01_06420 [Phycisphaerales bacterium]|nr:hypothetical protein [Phycisphaerales bacterium]
MKARRLKNRCRLESHGNGVVVVDDPFKVLGLPRQFALNPTEIGLAQTRALAVCHPDRQVEGVAREDAVHASAQVNAATLVLMDPLKRADALIAMGDLPGRVMPLSTTQLAALMEQRDLMSVAVVSGLAHQELCEHWIQTELESTLHQLRCGFEAPEISWQGVRACVAYLRALTRLSNEWAALRADAEKGGSGCRLE